MRKSGYYRVKYWGNWEIGQYHKPTNSWSLFRDSRVFKDSDFDKYPNGKPMIDETMINPEPQ